MSAGSIAIKYWRPLWKGTKAIASKWSHLCFGEGESLFRESLSANIKAQGFSNFGKNLQTAWKQIPATGGKKVYASIWDKMLKPESWKLDWNAARSLGKGKWASAFKTLGKRVPLIGNLMMIGFAIPNIYKAFTHPEGGIGTGILETAKEASRLGGGMAGAALGASLGSVVPVVGTIIGGLIGWTLGEGLVNKIVGKPFSEQIAEKEQQQLQQMPQGGLVDLYNQYAQMQQGLAQNPNMSNPFMAQNQQGFTSLAQMYQEYMMAQQALAANAQMRNFGYCC